MPNRYPSGLLRGIQYLEDTYKTPVRVWESQTRAWRFYLYLPELPHQEFTREDIIAMSNCNCYLSEDDQSYHFYMAL